MTEALLVAAMATAEVNTEIMDFIGRYGTRIGTAHLGRFVGRSARRSSNLSEEITHLYSALIYMLACDFCISSAVYLDAVPSPSLQFGCFE